MKKNYIRTGPDRSSDFGPKTVKTDLKTGPRTGPARTDPTLHIGTQHRKIEIF